MSQHTSRAFSRLLTLAALSGGFVSLSFAAGNHLQDGPRIQLMDSGIIEISGDPLRPLLLLAGEAEPGGRAVTNGRMPHGEPSAASHGSAQDDQAVSGRVEHGRRLRAREITRVPLDPSGHFSMPAPQSAGRMRMQVWQAPSSQQQAGAGYSVPITLGGSTQLMASAASAGDLVITEFMKDPSAVTDGHGEWIELYNAKAWRLDIEGVTLTDFSGASYVLANGGLGILLAPGERYVLGNDDDPATNGGVTVNQKWTGYSLKNSSDEILLYGTSGVLVDAVVYDDGVRWPDTSGMSISLTAPVLDTVSNDNPGLWCHSSTVIQGGSDTGTPGQPNDVCP